MFSEAEALSGPVWAVEVEGEGGKRGAVWTAGLCGKTAWDVGGEFGFEADEGGDGIGGAGAEAPLDGEAFFNMELDFGADFEGIEGEFDHFPSGIAVVRGDARITGGEGDLSYGGGACDDADEVVEGECLVDGREAVEAVWARRTEAEAEIDFGVRSDGGGHSGIVATPCMSVVARFASAANGQLPGRALILRDGAGAY